MELSSFLDSTLTLGVPLLSRGALIEEINRVWDENKKLTEQLTAMCDSYNELRKQLIEHSANTYQQQSGVDDSTTTSSRKRKCKNNDGSGDEEPSKNPKEEHLKTKISRVSVRTETSDNGLIVKDDYHWRKYGQKVTRDNPSPRAYFKCSFAPTCPVKKKVQRSAKDRSVIVATYEGEHNHPTPSKLSNSSPISLSTGNVVLCSPSIKHTSQPTITLDLTREEESYSSAEQMASTLVKDPSFRAALATAISGKFLRTQ